MPKRFQHSHKYLSRSEGQSYGVGALRQASYIMLCYLSVLIITIDKYRTVN